MNAIEIAAVAHEVDRAYCLAMGDTSQPAWSDAPPWQRESAVAGVEFHLRTPDATPEASHERWLSQKVADGWVYGEVKDPERKIHPCIRPYAELPVEQRAKYHLFGAVVRSLEPYFR